MAIPAGAHWIAPGSTHSSLGRGDDMEDSRMRKEALTLLLSSSGAIAWLIFVPVPTGAG